MPEALTKFKQQVTEFWSNLDKSQKNRLLITSVIIAVAVTLSIILLTRPNYTTLVSDVDKKQTGEMVSILNENKIWNKAENNGSSIIINAKDNNKAQIALAQKGYPKGDMAFEDAIKMIGISTTESDKKHIWKQQQTSDIAAKIKMMDNIEDASVSLALPEKSIFMTSGQEQPRPAAIVMVKPKERLTPEQVEGIVMIVSRSVENLNPKDISVVDNNSNILNRETGDDLMHTANNQEEMRQKKAIELQNRVYDYFSVDQFDNFDTIRVVANPYLDFDKEKAQVRSLKDPEGMDGGALISSDRLKEDLQDGTLEGVPGIDSNPGDGNLPSYQVGGAENSSYKRQHDINNFEYDETIKDLEKATGVILPDMSTMAISLWYGKRVTDDSKLSEEFVEQVKLAASTATGISLNNISVSKLRLAQIEVIKKSASEVIRDIINDYGFFALMVLLVIGLMVAAIPRKKDEEIGVTDILPVTAAGLRFAVPEDQDEYVPEIAFGEKSEIKKQLDKFVRQKPEAVAQLLRNWLSDERDG